MRDGQKTGGHATGGGVIFEGHARGAFVHRWAEAREWGGRKMSVNQFEKGKRKEEEEEEGGKRSRALSCRPGSQIRSGLKRGVDCV